MHSVLFSALLCCVLVLLLALVLRNVLILVAFSVLLLVLACDVWENLGKWNKMGVLCVFGSLALVVLLCGASAGCSLRSALVCFGALAIFTPPHFFAFSEKIFEFISCLFFERLGSMIESERKIFCRKGLTV